MRATCPEHARYNPGCPHCWRAREDAAKLSLAQAPGSVTDGLRREARINGICGSEEWTALLTQAADDIERMQTALRTIMKYGKSLPYSVRVLAEDALSPNDRGQARRENHQA